MSRELLKRCRDTLQTLIECDDDPCQDLMRLVSEIDDHLKKRPKVTQSVIDKHCPYESRYGESAKATAFHQGFRCAESIL